MEIPTTAAAVGIEIPEELRRLKRCSDTTKFKTFLMFDGVAGLSRTMKIVKPITVVRFRENLRVNHARGNTFKGLSVLRSKSCYELDLCGVGGFMLSIVFPVDIFIPSTYLDYPKFTSRIYRIIKQSIAKVYASTVNMCHHDYLSKPLDVHPEEWELFSDMFEQTMSAECQRYQVEILEILKQQHIDVNRLNTDKLKKPVAALRNWTDFGSFPFNCSAKKDDIQCQTEYYLHARRMGQDIQVPDCGVNLCDKNRSTAQNIEDLKSWNKAWDEYDVLNMHKSEFKGCRWLTFHIAKDLESSHENMHLVWLENEVKQQLELNYEVYHVFGIPSVANLRRHLYQYHDSMRFIQLYCRFGHEFHRNSTTIFTRSMVITKRIVEMLGSKVFVTKRKAPALTYTDRQILDKIPMTQVQNWIEDAGTWGSKARLEIVYEVDCGDVKWECALEDYFAVTLLNTLHQFLNFIKVRKLNSPSLLMEIPCEVMKGWLEKTLRPCCKAIENAVDGLESSNTEVIHQGVQLIQIQRVFYAEAIIGFFIRGKLPTGFPEVVNSDLMFLKLQLGPKVLENGWKIANVSVNAEGELTVVNIPNWLLNRLTPEWLLGPHKNDSLFSDLLQAYKKMVHTKVGKKSAITKEYKAAVKELSKEIIIFIQKQASADSQRKDIWTNTRDLAIDTLSEFKQKILICPLQLWKIIVARSINPQTGAGKLLECFISKVETDNRLIKANQKISLGDQFVMCLDKEILSQKCPYFCWFERLPLERPEVGKEILYCVFPTAASANEKTLKEIVKIFWEAKLIFPNKRLPTWYSKFKMTSDTFHSAMEEFLKENSDRSLNWMNTNANLYKSTSPYQQFFEVLDSLGSDWKDHEKSTRHEEVKKSLQGHGEGAQLISDDLLQKLVNLFYPVESAD